MGSLVPGWDMPREEHHLDYEEATGEPEGYFHRLQRTRTERQARASSDAAASLAPTGPEVPPTAQSISRSDSEKAPSLGRVSAPTKAVAPANSLRRTSVDAAKPHPPPKYEPTNWEQELSSLKGKEQAKMLHSKTMPAGGAHQHESSAWWQRTDMGALNTPHPEEAQEDKNVHHGTFKPQLPSILHQHIPE